MLFIQVLPQPITGFSSNNLFHVTFDSVNRDIFGFYLGLLTVPTLALFNWYSFSGQTQTISVSVISSPIFFISDRTISVTCSQREPQHHAPLSLWFFSLFVHSELSLNQTPLLVSPLCCHTHFLSLMPTAFYLTSQLTLLSTHPNLFASSITQYCGQYLKSYKGTIELCCCSP